MNSTPSLCIHAHFYQPPREDPFTNSIPDEPGAEPYRNWNERILDTCYRPNAELGNYGKISFNIGPTLTSWMADNSSAVLDQIVAEDRRNFKIHGVGNAIAQPYNHTILPLSTRRDKETQVMWGIEGFKQIFGRNPEGMWLPETAVDLETLNVLAEQGIQFTILAPWQVAVPNAEEGSPFRIELTNGRSIVVFLYNGDLSSRVSFDEQATTNADKFAENLILPAVSKTPSDGLTIIATDGELYGHHQIFRDKFLAHLLNGSTSGRGVKTTYPGLWLLDHEVTRTAKIIDNTSWSCHHGIERWRSRCACTPTSGWKKPMRTALDLLADEIDAQFERCVAEVEGDAWAMRNRYIDVILGKISFDEWLGSFWLKLNDKLNVGKLEMLFKAQYERQRMFTSCGWFFDSLDRIEPINNLSYAAHAYWLMEKVTAFDPPYAFWSQLCKANGEKSHLTAKERFLNAYTRFTVDTVISDL